MPTRGLRRQRELQQQSLFQAPRAAPQWRLLPETVRAEVSQLLTLMVHEHQQRNAASAAGEVSDE